MTAVLLAIALTAEGAKVDVQPPRPPAFLRLTTKTDEFTGVVTYRPPYSPAPTVMAAVLCTPTNPCEFGVNFMYSGEDWIFMRAVYVKSRDTLLTLVDRDPRRSVGRGYVLEQQGFIGLDALKAAKLICSDPKVRIRFDGAEGDRDFTPSEDVVRGVCDAVTAYEYLTRPTVPVEAPKAVE